MSDAPAAVLWDMDGTLLDSEKLWDVAIAELADRLGTTMTAELRESTLGNSMTGALTKLFAAAGEPVTEGGLGSAAQWLRGRVVELFADGVPWQPGARAALEMVARHGIPMALVTNTERMLTEHAVRTIGAERFAVSFCADEVANGKPEPDLYLAAADALGVRPEDCVAVEDSPAGTAAAIAAGCPTLVVPSEAPVPAGPGRVFRAALTGLTLDDLVAVRTDATVARGVTAGQSVGQCVRD
ncbi:HAD family hydrolase [Williamsia sterculiae]|uniref:Haloacid dehalogenase superfamily, subfamily IA, variant 3 with third motif having DD or ED n=1 Tax=Williamsia sterculiae TaxID=1344003 RepID=A0A1N7EM51_9NOCA|nr:HAD family phosphatase [Williamsia sterculiae]SIR89148.1 haloacid dehalogenase superfamily, subfamily IA, variant 3 with third motif having DD or ED [Williamsia sterculiae]